MYTKNIGTISCSPDVNFVTSNASDTILKALIFISVNMIFPTLFPVKYRQFLNYNTLLPC